MNYRDYLKKRAVKTSHQCDYEAYKKQRSRVNKIVKIGKVKYYHEVIYNCSTPIFPDDWKMARVAPTFKAGNKEDCDNYRPISILTTVAKIFEKLICGQRNKYLVNQNVLSKHHPGFREGHLTSPSLLSTTNSWLLNIVSGMIKECEVPCIKYKPL